MGIYKSSSESWLDKALRIIEQLCVFDNLIYFVWLWYCMKDWIEQIFAMFPWFFLTEYICGHFFWLEWNICMKIWHHHFQYLLKLYTFQNCQSQVFEWNIKDNSKKLCLAEKELKKSEQRLETRIISIICNLKILFSLHTEIGFISSMRSCMNSSQKTIMVFLGKMALLWTYFSPSYSTRDTQSISGYQKHTVVQ